MIDYTENLEWKILSVKSTKVMHKFKGSMTEKPLIFCNIILERHSANRKATVVVPAIGKYITVSAVFYWVWELRTNCNTSVVTPLVTYP